MKRITSLFLLLFVVAAAMAQSHAEQEVAIDPELRHGRLESGLSYYIRHNEKPKGQADFYIISDVGAIQERDDQQGLAHFLEHMAFNGTKNMPGKQIINYLESIGVEFGANLNASTSWDVTQYLIRDVPVEREGVVDSLLLILHDWSHFIEPQNEEVDKERGVIKEELRTRDSASWRSTMELIKALGRGTQYEHRNLIGYLDYLSSFEYGVLHDFYEQWYRPEYQTLIIVGDIDVDEVERKLIERMKDIPASSADVEQKAVIVVPDNVEPIISIYSDVEMQSSSASIFVKRRASENGENSRLSTLRRDMAVSYISMMQNDRLEEISSKPDAPFMGAYMGSGSVGVIPTLEVTTYEVEVEDGGLKQGLSAVVREMERAQRHGFTEGEFERTQRRMMRSAERSFASRGDRYNSSFVRQYINNFRFNTPIPSAEDRWVIDSMLIADITLEEVNRIAAELITDDNNVITISTPEKVGLEIPTEADVVEWLTAVRGEQIAPYEDQGVAEHLIDQAHEFSPSAVVETTINSTLGSTEWRLENGIQVVVRPSTLKADEVRLSFTSRGGSSILGEDESLQGRYLPRFMANSGIGEFSSVELGKVLAGKIASLSLFVSDYSNGGSGSSSPADLETMLQLLYLNFVSPRFDRDDYDTYMRQMAAYVENSMNNPDYIFGDTISRRIYQNNPRMRNLSKQTLEGMSFDRLAELHAKLYSNAADFRFTIVGNVDLDTLKPLVERYIGSLPTTQGQKMDRQDVGVRNPEGVATTSFTTPMQQPKASVYMNYWGEAEFGMRESIVMEYLDAALDDRFLNSVREEQGGTYGVRLSGSLSEFPIAKGQLSISFDTNIEQVEELIPIVKHEIEKMADEGPSAEQLDKTRKVMLKNYDIMMESNGGLQHAIGGWYNYGYDYISDYKNVVGSITAEDVQSLLRHILEGENHLEIVMLPE